MTPRRPWGGSRAHTAHHPCGARARRSCETWIKLGRKRVSLSIHSRARRGWTGGAGRGVGEGTHPTPRAMATPAVRSMMLGDRRVCIGAPRWWRKRAPEGVVRRGHQPASFSSREFDWRREGCDGRRAFSEGRRRLPAWPADTRARRKSRSDESQLGRRSRTNRRRRSDGVWARV